MGKLVRDRIPDIIRESGREPDVRRVEGEELRKALKDKLVEEALELKDADDVSPEMADVLEVIDAIYEAYGISPLEVEKIRDNKRKERGAFKEGQYLIK